MSFTVIESRKGDLKSGDKLVLPELKPESDAAPIFLYPEGKLSDHTDMYGISGRYPEGRWRASDDGPVHFDSRICPSQMKKCCAGLAADRSR
jgi:hypothetical protein